MGKLNRAKLLNRLKAIELENPKGKRLLDRFSQELYKSTGIPTESLRLEMNSIYRSFVAWLQMATLETGSKAKNAFDELAANIDSLKGSIRRILGPSLPAARYMLGWHEAFAVEIESAIGRRPAGITEGMHWLMILDGLLHRVRAHATYIQENALNSPGAGNFGEALTGGSSTRRLVDMCREALVRHGFTDEKDVLKLVQTIHEAVIGDELTKSRQGKSQVARKLINRPK